MTVEVGSLTDDKRSALEGILGRSVQRNEVVPVSRDMLERLSDADITVSSVLINPQLLDPEYQSVLINTFGEHWLGAMADPMDVGTIPAAQQILRNTGMDLPRMVIDTRSFTDKQYRVLEPKYGFKQLALLPRIDRQTFQALMAVDENDYRQRLAPCMDREALDAAVLRLRDAKRRAEELEKRQCVVDDWEAPGFLSALVRERKGNPEGLSSVMQNCLFLRDFWECAGLAARV